MIHDWIRMKTDLFQNPRVIRMAERLYPALGYPDTDPASRCVTLYSVTRHAVVGALLTLWGVMRHAGQRHEDDLVCAGSTLQVVDALVHIPDFGRAMCAVGWMEETSDGLVFPRFFEDLNTEPPDKRAKARERQRRHRARKNGDSVTRDGECDTSVTSRSRRGRGREEKRDGGGGDSDFLSNKTSSPSCTNTAHHADGGTNGGGPASSLDVENRLLDLGMVDARRVVSETRLSPAEAMTVIDYWQAQDRWTIAALHVRLSTGLPGTGPSKGWLPDDPEKARKRREKQERARRQKETEEYLATKRICALRGEGLSDDAIEQRLAVEGVEWPKGFDPPKCAEAGWRPAGASGGGRLPESAAALKDTTGGRRPG